MTFAGIDFAFSLFDLRASKTATVLSARPIAPFSGSSGDARSPSPLNLSAAERARWPSFAERNLGFLMLLGASQSARELLRRFELEYVRQVNDTSSPTRLVSDQPAWRATLFTALSRHASKVRETLLPPTTVCRFTQATLDAHWKRHGAGNCGGCLLMHHKAVGPSLRVGAWAGLEDALRVLTTPSPERQRVERALASLPRLPGGGGMCAGNNVGRSKF